MAGDFQAIVAAWERSLATAPSSPNDLGYIDDYVRSLWIVSLALIFRADDALWQRILVCAGNEGRGLRHR